MALVASWLLAMVTKANPRGRPLSRSWGMKASCCVCRGGDRQAARSARVTAAVAGSSSSSSGRRRRLRHRGPAQLPNRTSTAPYWPNRPRRSSTWGWGRGRQAAGAGGSARRAPDQRDLGVPPTRIEVGGTLCPPAAPHLGLPREVADVAAGTGTGRRSRRRRSGRLWQANGGHYRPRGCQALRALPAAPRGCPSAAWLQGAA
jgi:hypothetical protein